MKGPRCKLARLGAAVQALFILGLLVWYVVEAVGDWL